MGVVRFPNPSNDNRLQDQGYPEDLVVSTALGADMFDCVWPTRTAVSLSMKAFGGSNNDFSGLVML